MAQDALAAAKAALNKSNTDFSGAQAAAIGVTPAGARNLPAPKMTPAPKVTPAPKGSHAGTDTDKTAEGIRARKTNEDQYNKAQSNTPTGNPAPKMHKGGVVKKSGTYQMQKGEGVISARKMAAMQKGIHVLKAVGKGIAENKKSGGLTTVVEK